MKVFKNCILLNLVVASLREKINRMNEENKKTLLVAFVFLCFAIISRLVAFLISSGLTFFVFNVSSSLFLYAFISVWAIALYKKVKREIKNGKLKRNNHE